MSTYVQGVDSLNAISKGLAATPAQVDRALKRAVASTTKWATTEARSGIARALGIKIAAFKGRARIYIKVGKDNVGKAWMGLDDLPSSRLNPQQDATGASMEGRGHVDHAFVQTAKNGKRFMFLRRGALRYPMDQVSLSIYDVATGVVGGDVFPRVETKLKENFERELQREVLK